MKQSIAKNLPLIIGVGLPLLFLLAFFVFAFLLPSLFVNPSYNFLYVSPSYYGVFKVENQRIIYECITSRYSRYDECENYKNNAQIYMYDVERGANTPVSLEEAQRMVLDSSDVSPDGYRLRSAAGGDGYFFFPLFWGSSGSSGFAIEKNALLRKQVEIKGRYNNVKFLGWILK